MADHRSDSPLTSTESLQVSSRTSSPRSKSSHHELKADLDSVWTSLGICALFGIGFGLGLGLPSSNDGLPWPLNRVAQVAGWLYFAAWSLSFYPQVILNFQRKSIVGFSLDFAVANFFAFLCLSVYYASFAWSPTVRRLYRQAYGSDSPVRLNDVFFALHAAALTAVTLFQCAIYDRGSQKISSACKLAVLGFILLICMHGMLVLADTVSFLSWLYALSLIKLGITMSKYIPQIVLNMKRHSTVGWSVEQVLLDLFGGVLSVAQVVIEACALVDLTLIVGDPIKILLGMVSIGYDVVLLSQHYWLYPVGRQRYAPVAKETEDRESDTISSF